MPFPQHCASVLLTWRDQEARGLSARPQITCSKSAPSNTGLIPSHLIFSRNKIRGYSHYIPTERLRRSCCPIQPPGYRVWQTHHRKVAPALASPGKLPSVHVSQESVYHALIILLVGTSRKVVSLETGHRVCVDSGGPVLPDYDLITLLVLSRTFFFFFNQNYLAYLKFLVSRICAFNDRNKYHN